MLYKLILIKKKNIIENCGTIDYYKDEKVGELIFKNKKTAQSIGQQLIQQKLIEDCTLVTIEV